MKNLSVKVFIIAIGLSCAFSCRDGLLEEVMNRKGLAKKVRVQEMIREGRHYQFVYDNKGYVDYISASQEGFSYIYDVTYKKKQLFSSELVEEGEVVTKNHQFEFDDEGNIIAYTYTSYFEGIPGGVHTEYELEYDDQGRLIAAWRDGNPIVNTISYDNDDNIVRWITPNIENTYSYDDGLNPLYLIPDLFVLMVEEPFWEFFLSEHNMVTRSQLTKWNMETHETVYTNEYDAYNRLVRQTDAEGEELIFIYEPLKGPK